ncbi:MAG: cysteine synthase A [Rhizobiales bacterium 62-17]|nr:cysteine synthase A [Hyphomicrobiales bacterium]OJY05761.1 MAG: cysteine synthase A [Rhizobiales bacterium 62-17]
MSFVPDVIGAIGNTPLIKLKRASELTGCTILGKAEFVNPGGSVKDRAGLAIIKDAVAKGQLKPGGIIVEGTAGNTGIGIALVANAMGFRTVIVIPETQSQEKKDMLRLQGAELIEVPAVPYSNPNNYVKVSGRIAEKLAKEHPHGAIWANQFDNVANRQGHIDTTGPEIYAQTDGKVDGFTCAVGTGGSLAGVGMALKARNKDIKIAITDPMGAALYSYYTTGTLKSEGSSITEGIGQGRITANLVDAPIDMAFQVPDEEALPIVFELAEHEGLLLGGSSGINVAGAIRMAKEMGPGHTIVTLLADSGVRYASKLFNPAFLREKKLPVPDWMERTSTVDKCLV